MTKTFIWLGIIVGSSIGGAVPMIWGDGVFSGWSLALSTLGAFVGIFVGYKLGQMTGG